MRDANDGVRTDRGTQVLYGRLQAVSDKLGARLRAESAVGGPAATILDYQSVAAERLPLIVIILTVITALLLGVLLRSIVVTIGGVVLNLLAVGATLGPRPALPGRRAAAGRPRVHRRDRRDRDLRRRVRTVDRLQGAHPQPRARGVAAPRRRTAGAHVGMAGTARVVTGAALSMLGVFVAFGFAGVASLRRFGVGLAIAIVVDPTLVRLVMLPAALYFAGEWTWYRGFEEEPVPAAT